MSETGSFETGIFRDMMLGIFVFILAVNIFGSVFASTGGSISSPATKSINSTISILSGAETGITYSFNNATIISNVTSSNFFYPIVAPLNGLWKIVSVVFALIILCIASVVVFLLFMFVVIPGILPATILGPTWGSLIGLIDFVLSAVLIVYGAYIARSVFTPIIGIVEALIP